MSCEWLTVHCKKLRYGWMGVIRSTDKASYELRMAICMIKVELRMTLDGRSKELIDASRRAQIGWPDAVRARSRGPAKLFSGKIPR